MSVVPRPSPEPVPTALVLAGGAPLPLPLVRPVPTDAVVIAADGGLSHAAPLGLAVDVIVGDLDSASPAEVAAARARGARVERHPTDKDATDLALALDVAVAHVGVGGRVVVLGGHGGRLDHLVANLGVLSSGRLATVTVDAVLGDALVTVVRGARPGRAVRGRSDELVTLIAVHGAATGVTTSGLAFSLLDADLGAGSSLGVSNRLVDDHATVTVREGTVLVIQPEPHPEDPWP